MADPRGSSPGGERAEPKSISAVTDEIMSWVRRGGGIRGTVFSILATTRWNRKLSRKEASK